MARSTKFTVLDSEGSPVAGDDLLDGVLKSLADDLEGTIVDRAGQTVYEGKGSNG